MNITFVSVCLLQKNKKFLVSQRPKNKPYPFFWEFPGGKCKTNESFESAAVRELKEELNITIDQNYLHQIDFMVHSYKKNEFIIMQLFLVTKWKGFLKSLEKQKIKWVSKNSIHKMNFLEGSKLFLDRIKSNYYNL